MQVVWPVPVSVVLSTVQFIYFYRTTSLMSKILFKICFSLNNEVLQGNTAVFLILHSLKDWLLVEETFTGQYHSNYDWYLWLIWNLKQVKDFFLNFSKSGSFFSKKEFLNFYTMVLVSFPSGYWVYAVVQTIVAICLNYIWWCKHHQS